MDRNSQTSTECDDDNPMEVCLHEFQMLIEKDPGVCPHAHTGKYFDSQSPDYWEAILRTTQCALRTASLTETESLFSRTVQLRDFPAWALDALQEACQARRVALAIGRLAGAKTTIETTQQFQIEGPPTVGGNKRVYPANHQNFGTGRSAFKIPINSSRWDKLIEEAKLLALIAHQNIPAIRCFDDGSNESKICFLVEDWIEGKTWEEILKSEWSTIQATNAESRSAAMLRYWRRQLELLLVICQPVRFVHEAYELIHGDLKPDNVRIRAFANANVAAREPQTVYDYGEMFLCDWGEAVLVAESATGPFADRHRSRIDVVIGTSGYRSSGVDGARPERLCPQSDVYSLGAVVRRIVTGQHPPEPDSTGKTPPLPHLVNGVPVPVELLAIHARATDHYEQRRYQAVAGFMRAVETFLKHWDAESRIHRIADHMDQWLTDNPDSAHHVSSDSLAGGIALANSMRQATQEWTRESESGDQSDGNETSNTNEPPAHHPLNEAFKLERQVRERTVHLAIRSRDFGLAETERERMMEIPLLSPEDTSELELKITSARRRATALRGLGWTAIPLAIVALVFAGWSQIEREKNTVAATSLLLEKKQKENEQLLRLKAESEKARAENTAAEAVFSERRNLLNPVRKYSSIHSVLLAAAFRDAPPRADAQIYPFLSESIARGVCATSVNQLCDVEKSNSTDSKFSMAQANHSLHYDQSWLVVTSANQKPRLRGVHVPTRSRLAILDALDWPEDEFATAAVISHDGAKVAVALQTGILRIYDLKSASMMADWKICEVSEQTKRSFAKARDVFGKELPIVTVLNLAWSPDDSAIAAVTMLPKQNRVQSELSLCNPAQPDAPPVRVSLDGMAPSIHWLNRSNVSQIALATSGTPNSSGKLELLNGTDGAPIASYPLLSGLVSSSVVDVTGRLMAIGGEGRIEMWELPDQPTVPLRPLDVIPVKSFPPEFLETSSGEDSDVAIQEFDAAGRLAVMSVSFSPDRRLLAATLGDGTLHVINTATAEAIDAGYVMPGASAISENVAAYFTKQGALVTTDSRGSSITWDFEADQELRPGRFGFDLDQSIIVAHGTKWRVSGGAFAQDIQLGLLNPENPAGDCVIERTFSLNGAGLIGLSTIPGTDDVLVLTTDDAVSRIDPLQGTSVSIVAPPGFLSRLFSSGVTAQHSTPNGPRMAVNRDGSMAAIARAKQGLILIDLQKNQPVAELLSETEIFDLTFNPQRPTEIAVSAAGIPIQIYETGDPNNSVMSLGPPQLRGFADGRLRYNPNGQQLLAERSGVIRVFDRINGNELFRWQSHDSLPVDKSGFAMKGLLDLVFLPDGRLATMGNDQRVRLWKSDPDGVFKLLHSVSLQSLGSRQFVADDSDSLIPVDPRLAERGFLLPIGRDALIAGSAQLPARTYDLRMLDASTNISGQDLLNRAENRFGLVVSDSGKQVRAAPERIVKAAENTLATTSELLEINRINVAAASLLNENRPDEALLLWHDLIQSYPFRRQLYFLRAQYFSRMGKYAEAAMDYRAGLRPVDLPIAGVNLQFENAEIAKAMAVSQRDTIQIARLAETLAASDQFEEALQLALSAATRIRLGLQAIDANIDNTQDRDNLAAFRLAASMALKSLEALKRTEDAEVLRQVSVNLLSKAK